jgi:hypothetical protein
MGDRTISLGRFPARAVVKVGLQRAEFKGGGGNGSLIRGASVANRERSVLRRADFEAAWSAYLPRCTDADFEAYRRQDALEVADAGYRLYPQNNHMQAQAEAASSPQEVTDQTDKATTASGPGESGGASTRAPDNIFYSGTMFAEALRDHWCARPRAGVRTRGPPPTHQRLAHPWRGI